MYASKVSLSTLQRAADAIGVEAQIETLNAAGTRHRVKLNLDTPIALYRPPCKHHRTLRLLDPHDPRYTCRCRRYQDEQGDAKYQRQSPEGRRVNAVCWHGFRDYFRACFTLEPNAIFRTSLDTWKGSEDFEARFQRSGYKNIGSMMNPCAFAEACRCPEAGSVGRARVGSIARELAENADDSRLEWQEGYCTLVVVRGDGSPIITDDYGASEADGAACRAMSAALASIQKERKAV